MSFKINLYSFAKDSNSTAQPVGTGTELTCNILSPADIIAPLVEIKHSDPTAFNYAYIAAFHRYYFIEGITYNEGLWILNLRCDVLATYKTEIGAQSLYVLRSASAYDGDITDNYYPVINDIVQSYEEDPNFSYAFTSGRYILSIAGTESSGYSSLYQLTPANFKQLISNLYQAIDGFQLADVIKSVVKTFGGNPEKLINGAMWIPTSLVDPQVADTHVKIGSWDSGVDGKLVDNPGFVLPTVSLSIAAHPQVSKGRYLNLSPFSRYILYLPGIGQISLDTTQLEGVDAINILRAVDALTGKIVYRVLTHPMTGNTNSPLLLYYGETQWGVPVSLGGNNISSSSVIGTIGSTVANVGAAIASGGATAIIGAAAGGIGSAVSAMEGQSAGSSTGGSLGMHFNPIRLDTTFCRITSWDDTHNGRPLMQTRTISTLSGFIMVQKGDVPIAGTSQEADEIRSLLEGGFYYE